MSYLVFKIFNLDLDKDFGFNEPFQFYITLQNIRQCLQQ
jgi:hypothetical protein